MYANLKLTVGVWLVLALVGPCCRSEAQTNWKTQRAPRAYIRWEEAEQVATKNFWQSQDGDTTAAASWSLGHVPTSGEQAVCDKHSQVDLTVNATAGGVGPDTFVTTEDFHGNIGGPGNFYNNFTTNTEKITLRGTGKVWIAPIQDSAAVLIDNDSAEVFLNDTITAAFIKRGHCTLVASGSLKTHLGLYTPTAKMTIQDGAGTFPDHIRILAGVLTSDRSTSTGTSGRLVCAGGVIRQTNIIHADTFVYLEGGTLEYAPTTDPSGQSINLFLDAGIFDASDSDFAIATATVVFGPDVVVLGSIVEGASAWPDFDLRELYLP